MTKRGRPATIKPEPKFTDEQIREMASHHWRRWDAQERLMLLMYYESHVTDEVSLALIMNRARAAIKSEIYRIQLIERAVLVAHLEHSRVRKLYAHGWNPLKDEMPKVLPDEWVIN